MLKKMHFILAFAGMAFFLCPAVNASGPEEIYHLPDEAAGGITDSIPLHTLVHVEGFDKFGRRISFGTGIIVKKGFIATNYHLVAGMTSVTVTRNGDAKAHESNGYLSVEESKDLIVLSVPGLSGTGTFLNRNPFPEDGSKVVLVNSTREKRLTFAVGTVSGKKEIRRTYLPQIVTMGTRECTNGPVFKGNKTIGFCTAGYFDEKYYAYVVPVEELIRIANRSFIIKSFNSLTDTKPIEKSFYQKALIESLTSVLWMSMESAEELGRMNKKMIFINVCTPWSGYCKLLEKNTFSKKSVIRYLNENFYSVKLDPETGDTITFNNLTYFRNFDSHYHSLAYSLLDNKMEFPSLVLVDEELRVLLVIPGYMDPAKMEVMLHFFNEKVYLNNNIRFTQYEEEYWKMNR